MSGFVRKKTMKRSMSVVTRSVNAKPRTEPMARMIIGTVMVAGDSCGWSCASQRRRPWKVMKNRRDM